MFDFLFKKKTAELPELFFHTDIHCHIMPGVDHGSPDVETSLKLIESEQSWGINRIVLTSHVTESTFENTPETLAAGFERLTAAVKEAGNDIKLAYSAEYRIDSLFSEQYADGKLIKMPGDFLLVENSFIQEPWGLDNLLFDLKINGYKTIMAHPERFPYYYEDKKRYDKRENHPHTIFDKEVRQPDYQRNINYVYDFFKPFFNSRCHLKIQLP